MSKPQNILGKFDTYAYHHILVVCDSTATAEGLAKSTEITSFQHPRTEQERYASRNVPGVDGGKYVTLIDGTTDARFFITEARFNTVIAPEPQIENGVAQSTTMASDGSMEIIEPLGASFLNRLTDISDELDTDPVGLIFLLKTIFVGRNSDGTTEMISSVRPFMFIAFDITAVFDSSGAKYHLEFVGLTNGAAQLPQPQQIFGGLSFKMGDTLKETFDSITKNANEKYQSFKKDAIKQFAATLDGVEKNKALTQAQQFLFNNYRDVTYKIKTRDYTNEKYKTGDLENIRIADGLKNPSINYGEKVGLEEILNRVMASSEAVVDDTKRTGDPKNLNSADNKYIYKIISTLRTSPNDYVIEYHVNKYLQTVSPYTQQEKDGNIIPLPGQSIEFDYIFTGKNVDIKNFDIKMEMGMAFFQIAATSDNIPSQKETREGPTSAAVKTTGSDSNASTGKKRRGKTPLFLGTTITKPVTRNTTRPIDSAGFQALLERHASLENVAANMTIYGNPQLLDEMSIYPSEVEAGKTEDPEKDATINPLWMSTPTLIKVNIRMPVDTNDVNTEYEQFWYSGYYNLQQIENIFSEGVFTQELGMYSIPITDAIDEAADDTKTKTPPDKETGFFQKIVNTVKSLIGYDDGKPAEKNDVRASTNRRLVGAPKPHHEITKKG